MESRHYILDGKELKPVTLIEWAEWFQNADRVLAKDIIDSVIVSTVFLGLDHSFTYGPPIVFETMIFGGEHDQYQERYSTYDEALAGHKKALDMVKMRAH